MSSSVLLCSLHEVHIRDVLVLPHRSGSSVETEMYDWLIVFLEILIFLKMKSSFHSSTVRSTVAVQL